MRGRALAVIPRAHPFCSEIAFIVWWIMTGHTVEELSAILSNFYRLLQSRSNPAAQGSELYLRQLLARSGLLKIATE